MCDYTQVEYCCQHFRFVVQRWCSVYERTNKVCAPNVTHLEVRHDELCCKLLLFHTMIGLLQGLNLLAIDAPGLSISLPCATLSPKL
ncbi:hypothetical protein F5B19DRAFT_42535 [Rostrohypoxylon terebratum]|nr:hypothetical protein F5B19DRAFT_42535 [Rostrohypoxylon terebratum]